MYPGRWSHEDPDHPAIIMAGSGEVVTYAELEDRSLRLARLLHERGLRPDGHVAVMMENQPRYFDVIWAGLRSGLHVTPVNRYLTAAEAGYILEDSGARALIVSETIARALPDLADLAPGCTLRLVVGGDVPGYERYEEAVASCPAEPIGEEPAGRVMFYSSGTTGAPKGITAELSGLPLAETTGHVTRLVRDMFGFDRSVTYLSPAPLYHASPTGFSVATHALGGTVVVMERFDAVDALRAIETYGVTHSQWVPTMFIRMLKLEDKDRTAFDLSSHRMAIHAAAPCPREVKEAMLEWWGPIIHEYYSGSESLGMTYAGPQDWLAHPGTVGRAVSGEVHICDDAGAEVGPGRTGLIYFARDRKVFEYHNAPEKTRAAYHPDHPTWATLGDVGHLDGDGYLYLTDRKSFMIVAGGVNIYPQEIEDVLVGHPLVADVAVIGVPNQDLGEEVKAVVELAEGVVAGPEVTEELLAYAGRRLARYKLPRSIDFVDELPRLPTGKLYKRQLRERYWPNGANTPAAGANTPDATEGTTA